MVSMPALNIARWALWLAAGSLTLLVGIVLMVLVHRLHRTAAALVASWQVMAWQARDQQHQVQTVAHEMAERRQNETGLQEHEAQYRSLIDHALQGILIHIDHTIRFANPAAARLFGYARADDLIGQDYRVCVAPTERERLDICIQAHLQGEVVPSHFACEGTKQDGASIWCEWVISQVIWEGQAAVMAICLDITARKQAELAWRDAKTAAEAARRAQQQFLANMSHELRTPLHAVLSYAGFGLTKAGTVSSEKLQQYFCQIDRSGKVLLAQLNDLLDLAKLEAGKMTFAFERIDLNPLLAYVADEFRALGDERQVVIDVLTPATPTRLRLDTTRLGQVIRNLVGNAVKFAPGGSTITIRLECRAQMAVVSVCDQGPGIPPDELETVFDRFVQSSTTATGAGGTGLGLAICYEIITAHGGRMWAENQPNGGARFAFALPLTDPSVFDPSSA